MAKSHYGASMHRSPAPMAVVGYYYPDGNEFGKREQVYRVEVTEARYKAVVNQIKRRGGTMKEKDGALFMAFKPPDTGGMGVETTTQQEGTERC